MANTYTYIGDPSSGSAFAAAGDLTGSSTSQTVTNIQGVAISPAPLNDGYVLTYDLGSTTLKLKPPAGSGFVASGDLSGTATSQNVIKINGASVPSAGSLTTGHLLQVSGSSATTYGLLTDSNVSASAAIAGTKISPDFGSQNVTTSGVLRPGGGTYASSGAIRLQNNYGPLIVMRDSGNAADIIALGASATDTFLGSGTSLNLPATNTNVTAATAVKLNIGSTAVVTATSSKVTVAQPTEFGSGTYPTSGVLRVASAGVSDILSTTSSTNATRGIIWWNGTDHLAFGSGSLDEYFVSNSLTFNTGAVNTVVLGASKTTSAVPIEVGPVGSGYAAAGNIRLANNAGTVAAIRNSGNSADLTLVAASTTDLYLGQDTSSGTQVSIIRMGATGNILMGLAGTTYVNVGTTNGTCFQSGNVAIGTSSPTYGSGSKVLFLNNASANPSTNPTAGVIAYVDAADGYFKTRTAAGQVIALNGAGGGGGVITATDHKTLRQIIHFIDGGPAEGFATNAYRETTGTIFPSAVIWWESSAKLKKIVSKDLTYNANNTINTRVWKAYDTDGSTVLATVTDTLTYSGIFETSRTRTIA